MSKFIRIGIADKNDNPPYFDKNLYEAEVDENEDIQHTVLTVTANDKDECKYDMVLTSVFLFQPCSQKIALYPLSQTKVCSGFEKRQLFSLQITKLHYVLKNNFDFTKSQMFVEKSCISFIASIFQLQGSGTKSPGEILVERLP